MIVVSDTTPLISLIKINRLDLLEKLFKTVFIPQGVFDELTGNSNYVDEASKIMNCKFIEIKAANKQSVSLFQRTTGLDLGESEAIVLTDELHADLTMLDEKHAREIATRIGLPIMGTIGILNLSRQRGYLTIDDIRHYIKIFKETNRHIDEELFKRLLDI